MEEEIDFKIQQAFSIVRNIFIADKEMYDLLVACIESALRESTIEREYSGIAKKIADRIIGND